MSMLPIRLGVDLSNHNKPFHLDPDCLSRHLHLVGATGTGKTTALHALLHPLMAEPADKNCLFLIDPVGNLSFDLLRWIASHHCPEHVRRRLLYVELARDDVVLPFNPLEACVDENRYYHVARSVDLILRAWSAQNLAEQPRLMQWSYKAMTAMAAMKFPIAISRFLLHPGTDEHFALLERLPDSIRFHWLEILRAKGGEAVRILESVRNRFDPFYESPQALRMFGSFRSRFDVERLIRERRIVIINVAPLGRIPSRMGNTIGALILNEIFETAFRMATVYGRASVEPTYILMDEFQKFVGPDIEDALPTVRQMGLRLMLAHQSFSQLIQGDTDLSNIIWQARNRLMFANSFEDADIIANELAVLKFNPERVKRELWTRRQLIAGYRTLWLESETTTETHADSRIDQRSVGYQQSDSSSRQSGRPGTNRGKSSGSSDSHTTGGTVADSVGKSTTRGQAMQPIHDEFDELSSVTYVPFDEQRLEWMKIVRELRTGRAFGRFLDDPRLYDLQIHFDPVVETPRLQAAYEELLQRNFEQDFFISRDEADRLAEQERIRLLTPPPIELPGHVLDLPPRLPNTQPRVESSESEPTQRPSRPAQEDGSDVTRAVDESDAQTPDETTRDADTNQRRDATNSDDANDGESGDDDNFFRRPPRTC